MRAFLLIFLPLLIAYETAICWCVELWWKPDYYFGHGPLVPLVMFAVLWQRRKLWRLQPAKTDTRAFWLLGPALFLHLCGASLTIDSLSAASLAIALPAAAWLALGRDRLRGLWPVLWLFLFAVPLPLYVTGRIAFELKEVAVTGGVWLAQFTGLDVLRQGAALTVPGQAVSLDVADPCGGLRSLLAMITLAYCIAFFLGPLQRRRLFCLLLLAAPIALAVNMFRIAAICWLAHLFDIRFATGTGHDIMNGVAWVMDMVLVFGIDSLVTKPPVKDLAVAEGPEKVVAENCSPLPSAVALRLPRGLRNSAVVLYVLMVPLVLLSGTKPYATLRDRAILLPKTIGQFVQEEAYDFPKRYFDLLGTDDVTWRRYVSGNESSFVVACFHGSNWKSVHPPHVCLLASDMDMLVDDDIDLGDGSTASIGRILMRTRKGGRPYLSLYAYVSLGLCTGSYSRFFLFHAPRALFRSSTDGFLIRVDAYGDGAGGLQGAQERCRLLLRDLLAEGLKLLK